MSNVFLQRLFTSRDNFDGANAEANAAAYVGQEGRLWWNPATNQFYSSDGSTPGGIPIGGGNGSGGGTVLVTSNVGSLEAGSSLYFNVNYANATYPGGIFTLEQGSGTVSSMVNTWESGSSSKAAYLDFANSVINTQDVDFTLSLTNATFDVKASDTIVIGTSTITGSNLTGLGISSTGGSYTIVAGLLSNAVQTTSTVPVSYSLTTSSGSVSGSGTTLTNIQPIPFSVTALNGSFAGSSVPFWDTDQTFTWSATLSSGAVADAGNVSYNGASSGYLTTTGATSGTSPTVDSSVSYAIASSDYHGSGSAGAGSRTIPSPVSGTVAAATLYYPMFYKTTGSSANPNFTTGDSHYNVQYATGQGANTTAVTTDYLWIATPTTTSRSFAFTFNTFFITIDPDVTYSAQTIDGATYNVYGFTNFNAATFIYTV